MHSSASLAVVRQPIFSLNGLTQWATNLDQVPQELKTLNAEFQLFLQRFPGKLDYIGMTGGPLQLTDKV